MDILLDLHTEWQAQYKITCHPIALGGIETVREAFGELLPDGCDAEDYALSFLVAHDLMHHLLIPFLAGDAKFYPPNEMGEKLALGASCLLQGALGDDALWETWLPVLEERHSCRFNKAEVREWATKIILLVAEEMGVEAHLLEMLLENV